jgi:hypothetical protein
MISDRYLDGEELLFPQSTRHLDATLKTLAIPRDSYQRVMSSRPPEEEGSVSAGYLTGC